MTQIDIERNIRKLIGKALVTTSTTRDGTPVWTSRVKWGRGHRIVGFGRFTVDHGLGPTYLLGRYEPEVVEAIDKYVVKGDQVIDAGAHVGYLSVYLAKKVGLGGRVFSFEPTPRNREILHRNKTQNGVDNVEILPFALSDRVGCARFMLDDSSYENRFVDDSVNGHPVITVPTTTLDIFVQSNKIEPAFVKMDIEGAELAALHGSKRILRNYRPTVVAEIRDSNWLAIRDFMGSMHYDSKVLSKPGSSHCRRGTPNVLFTPN